MRLNCVQLENFRNYQKLDISFDKDKNIALFIGDNAQGKTNFIEAITLLSLAKSFRTNLYSPLIKIGEEYTRIVGETESDNKKNTLEIFFSESPVKKKNVKKDGINIKIQDFIGNLNIVLFHPEDLNMLYLSPSLRRKYLNTLLSQTDPFYFDSLINYNKTLKQRNKTLFLIDIGKCKEDELYVWDEKLAEYGHYISGKRLQLVEFLNNEISENNNKISSGCDKLNVNYHISLKSGENSKKEFLENLMKNRARDLKYAKTTKGIHRDDIEFDFNGKSLSEFGSRGELRTLILALKLCEISYIKEQTGRKPILLLDDVFSELDKKRQKFLFRTIQKYQSFITTTHHDFPAEDASVFEIESGMLN